MIAKEPNIIHIDGDVTVVTCLRGSFKSLLHVLKTAGHPPKTRYIFFVRPLLRPLYYLLTSIVRAIILGATNSVLNAFNWSWH